MEIIIVTIQLLLVPTCSPLVIGAIRKIKARMQNRKGASVFQPYRDLWKLFHKDEVVSKDASWISRFAPLGIFSLSILIASGIPVLTSMVMFQPVSDFLVLIYLFAAGTFFLALAGLDAGSPFGGIGSSREMTVAALAEGGLLFSLLAVALTVKTTSIASMIQGMTSLPLGATFALMIAFVGFCIVVLAEGGRYPFDNPATHLELTMIHEAMILEFSGKSLALIEWAAWNKMLIFLILAVNVFFPWGIVTGILSISALFLAIVSVTVKVGVVASMIAVVESSIAKIRFFRIPDMLFVSFFLGVIAIVISVIR